MKNIIKCLLSFFFIYLLGVNCTVGQQFVGNKETKNAKYDFLPAWKDGYLDIHQISTGRGNCSFIIMPDGTTMVIDVGDLGDSSRFKQEIMPALPNSSKRPAEWIAKYIKNFIVPTGKNGLDYVLLTHFDSDHMGSADRLALSNPNRPYKLSGITHLEELIDINLLVDRGWPNYDYPTKEMLRSSRGKNFANYEQYVNFRHVNKKLIEKFKVGVKYQFKLLYNPSAYPGFEIRNVYSNGLIWTGSAEGTQALVPPITSIMPNQYPNENRMSNVITLKYGPFDYFSGGDILGVVKEHYPTWFDVETPVSKVVGPMDIVLANHHSYSDAMFSNFIEKTKPQAFIIPVWDYYHPEPKPLERMLSQDLYSGHREIYATGLVKNNEIRLGNPARNIKSSGHVVVRVFNRGKQFQIYVLNDRSTQYEIIYKSSIFNSK